MSDLGIRTPLREVAGAKPAEPETMPAEPQPLSPPPEQGGAVAGAGGGPQATSAARYRRRVLVTLGAIALALGMYWASGYFFAYTDDAYVISDFVSVAPYISGRVVAVPVVDNQTVTKGTVLAEIDPTPFQLALNEKQAKKTATRSPRPKRSATTLQRNSGWRATMCVGRHRSRPLASILVRGSTL